MKIAKLIQQGEDQVVCLPPEFQFAGNAVFIKKVGNVVLLLPIDNQLTPHNEDANTCAKAAEDSQYTIHQHKNVHTHA